MKEEKEDRAPMNDPNIREDMEEPRKCSMNIREDMEESRKCSMVERDCEEEQVKR